MKYVPGQDSQTVWVEGARSAECHLLWERFQSSATAANIQLPGTFPSVLANRLHIDACTDVAAITTCLLTDVVSGDMYLGQPWFYGQRWDVNTLDVHAVDVRDTLAAFSHFTYQMNNHNSVYVDFEGN